MVNILMLYKKEREAVAATMRRLYSKGLTTCSGGNISFRVSKDHVLITPSALDKGSINFRQIALMTLDGENISVGLKPSIETDMHLKILRTRPDVDAVVHAHPKYASLLTAAGSRKIDTNLLAEARFLLKEPAFAPYALMGTEDLGDVVSSTASGGADSILLENHGVMTLGTTLLQAYDRMEVLEVAAEMSILTGKSLDAHSLTPEQLGDIDQLHN